MMLTISHRVRTDIRSIIVAEAGERTTSMTTDTTSAELCSVCTEPVKGGFEVFRYSRLGIPRIELEPTPDTNFIVCDSCSNVVCYDCLDRPDSGICNDCHRIMSVSIDDDKAINRALTTTTMNQGPKIIHEEPQGSEAAAKNLAKRVIDLMNDRQVDIADFQGRVDSLSQKLMEIANDFQENMLNIDRAILDALHIADVGDEDGRPEGVDQFLKTN
jgi:hypothetical protein